MSWRVRWRWITEDISSSILDFERRTLALIVCINRRMWTLSFTVNCMTSMCFAPTPLWSSHYPSKHCCVLFLVRNQTGLYAVIQFFGCAKLSPLFASHFICDCPVFATGTVFALCECCLTPDVHSGRNYLVQGKKWKCILFFFKLFVYSFGLVLVCFLLSFCFLNPYGRCKTRKGFFQCSLLSRNHRWNKDAVRMYLSLAAP